MHPFLASYAHHCYLELEKMGTTYLGCQWNKFGEGEYENYEDETEYRLMERNLGRPNEFLVVWHQWLVVLVR